MRTVLAGIAVLGFFVLVNALTAACWALLGRLLTLWGIDSPAAGIVVGVVSIAFGLWVAKVIIERLGRNRARVRA